MKSRSEIWLQSLSELGDRCSVDTQRDAETLAKRVAQEGDSFFLVTLPRFGKDLEQALSFRRIPRPLFQGFKRKKLVVDIVDFDYNFPLETVRFGGGNPQFLGGFLDLVFRDHLEMTADELAFAEVHPDVILCPHLRSSSKSVVQMADAITAIRQLCLMFGKEKERCSESKTAAAYDQFIETDKELVDPLWIGEQLIFSRMVGSPTPEGLSD